jgi:hypothetical protein
MQHEKAAASGEVCPTIVNAPSRVSRSSPVMEREAKTRICWSFVDMELQVRSCGRHLFFCTLFLLTNLSLIPRHAGYRRPVYRTSMTQARPMT